MSESGVDDKYNVLIMIMDDQRFDTIHALGNEQILTPNLDRLSREGTFIHPYTTVPVCTPGRAELLTGRSAFNNGCRWFGEPIHYELVLLPRAFQQAGYRTCHVGKWHNNGSPREPQKGYDEVYRVMDEDLVDGYHGRGYWNIHTFVYEEGGEQIRGHSTELISEKTIEFIKDAPVNQPWFCYMALHSPHDPRTAPEPFASMYDPSRIELPANFMPEHPFDNGDMAIRDELLEEFPRRPKRIQKHIADYYAMISHHDYWFGKIFDAIERRGEWEKTAVIFTSDHGLAVGSHGLMGKENLYEHSQSVPLIIKGPGVPANWQPDFLAYQYDFYPTLCELVGIETPETVQGRSYLKELKERETTFQEYVCCAYRDCMRSIRDQRWKLIYYPKIDKTQLFDLGNDPHEASDLLADWRRQPDCLAHDGRGKAEMVTEPNEFGCYPVYPQQSMTYTDFEAIAQRLRAVMDQWRKGQGDPELADD